MDGKFRCTKTHQVFIVKRKTSRQAHTLNGIAMIWRGFKVRLLQLMFFFFISCQSTDKESYVYGNDCKLWLLFDRSISDSGKTPFILCFDKEYFNCYSIKSNGGLSKRLNDDLSYDLIEGGKWKIKNDSMLINNIAVFEGNINQDTIIIKNGIYLINVTDKYNINNYDSKNLIANFKGGSIDSINTILNYKEQKR